MDEERSKHAPRGGMSLGELERMLEEKLSIREMAIRADRSPSTIRYWLRKYGLESAGVRAGRKRVHGKTGDSAPQIVSICARHGSTVFALQSNGYYKCRHCNVEAVQRWRRNTKLRLVEEAGGSCALCGFDRMPAALQFHHVKPSTKSFGLSMRGLTRSIDKLREEASKCVLLCANCHAGVESGALQLPAHLSGGGNLSAAA